MCKRREFLRKLRGLGFKGPYRGTKHEFLIFENHRLTIPSNAGYSVPQLKFMLKAVEELVRRRIGVEEWESGRVGEWESGRVGEWESGRVGEWERL